MRERFSTDLGFTGLSNPGADRLLFWDNSALSLGWLTTGNSITITATTLDTIQDIRTTASPTFAGLTVDTDTFYVDAANNRAGFGTTTPSEQLEVQGLNATGKITMSKSGNLSGLDVLGQLGFRSYDPSAGAAGLLGYIQGIIIDQGGSTGPIDGAAGEGFEFAFTTAKRNSNDVAMTLTEAMRIDKSGNVGIGTTAPDRVCEINSATGINLRLTYNDSDGTATNYVDYLVTSGGNATITPSGGVVSITGDVRPATDNTYYLGKNDDDSPAAWIGVIVKDSTDGKYYRIGTTNGAVVATDLTD